MFELIVLGAALFICGFSAGAIVTALLFARERRGIVGAHLIPPSPPMPLPPPLPPGLPAASPFAPKLGPVPPLRPLSEKRSFAPRPKPPPPPRATSWGSPHDGATRDRGSDVSPQEAEGSDPVPPLPPTTSRLPSLSWGEIQKAVATEAPPKPRRRAF